VLVADGQSGLGRAGIHDIRRPQRRDIWFRRPSTAVQSALERRRSQLHDLRHREHHGRRIRQNQSRQPRHRSQRDRRWFGYTYFDPTKGHEFSAVASFTYNFENDHTQYKNGVDFHLDWGASQFLSKQFLIGLVGYIYRQVSCDSGAGDRVGCFESRVFGVGPQIGYIIPLGEWQGYLNLKGYGEFGAENRPEGWNIWLTFAISPAAAPPARTSMIRK
jgi:Putative MetA-pathway of phenol degradation